MIRQKHIAILKEANRDFKDQEFFNSASDILSLEINGNFEGTIFLEGRNDDSHEWTSIAAFNLSTLNTVLSGFSQPGIYEASIQSLKWLRIRGEEISGTVSIVVDLISSTEV